jgi:hypothetical protein
MINAWKTASYDTAGSLRLHAVISLAEATPWFLAHAVIGKFTMYLSTTVILCKKSACSEIPSEASRILKQKVAAGDLELKEKQQDSRTPARALIQKHI